MTSFDPAVLLGVSLACFVCLTFLIGVVFVLRTVEKCVTYQQEDIVSADVAYTLTGKPVDSYVLTVPGRSLVMTDFEGNVTVERLSALSMRLEVGPLTKEDIH